jgi:hypothetical protein
MVAGLLVTPFQVALTVTVPAEFPRIERRLGGGARETDISSPEINAGANDATPSLLLEKLVNDALKTG